MDIPIHNDTKVIVLSIFYFKGLPVTYSIKCFTSVLRDFFFLPNSADPDEMPLYAAFHLGLHCLPK